MLSLELLQEGNEAMDNDEEEAAEKNAQLEGPPGTMPASVARVATVAPGQTPAAEFCSKAQGWEAVPDFEGVPGFLIDPGVLEGLQGANPVPCLHQDRTLAACGCSLAAPAGARYWLLANVSCVWSEGRTSTEVVFDVPATAALAVQEAQTEVGEECLAARRLSPGLGYSVVGCHSWLLVVPLRLVKGKGKGGEEPPQA